MKNLRVWVCGLGIALAVGAGAAIGRAETVAKLPAPTGYVDDYAGVISAPAKTELEGLCVEVHEKTKAQVFLVTVKTLDGEAVERFANELFAKWKIGEKKTDRGILLLLAIQDHKRWIEVGYGFEGILNDAKVGDIGREMVPALKASNYDEAARIGVRDVSQVIATDAGVTLAGLADAQTTEPLNEVAPPIPEGIGQSSGGPKWVLFLLPFIFIGGFGLFVALVVWNIRKGVRFGGAGGGSGSSDSGSSFSDSSSSSSDSFSGGDGGSSGGGGAGGDW